MRIRLYILSIIALSYFSCDNGLKHDDPQKPILDDKNSSYELVSKRGYDEDLVENLYNEIVTQNIELKKLEDDITELNKSRDDSAYFFNKFSKKNQSYYNAANEYISEIKDSLLREKMKTLITKNFTKYNSSILKHKELLKTIESKNFTITDLHTTLKIIKTLPIIEIYQKENLPTTTSLEGYIKQQDETIKLADTLIKK